MCVNTVISLYQNKKENKYIRERKQKVSKKERKKEKRIMKRIMIDPGRLVIKIL